VLFETVEVSDTATPASVDIAPPLPSVAVLLETAELTTVTCDSAKIAPPFTLAVLL
jgi:hypothetical protein